MAIFFTSGLYTKIFYSEHEIDFFGDHHTAAYVKYDRKLLAEHYKNDLGLEYEDEDDKLEQVDEIFWDELHSEFVHFEPLVFDHKIALECGLTPFSYKDTNMLALLGGAVSLRARLDAYQVLAHGTIDRNSGVFSRENPAEYFENAFMDKKVAQKVIGIISELLNNHPLHSNNTNHNDTIDIELTDSTNQI